MIELQWKEEKKINRILIEEYLDKIRRAASEHNSFGLSLPKEVLTYIYKTGINADIKETPAYLLADSGLVWVEFTRYPNKNGV